MKCELGWGGQSLHTACGRIKSSSFGFPSKLMEPQFFILTCHSTQQFPLHNHTTFPVSCPVDTLEMRRALSLFFLFPSGVLLLGREVGIRTRPSRNASHVSCWIVPNWENERRCYNLELLCVWFPLFFLDQEVCRKVVVVKNFCHFHCILCRQLKETH